MWLHTQGYNLVRSQQKLNMAFNYFHVLTHFSFMTLHFIISWTEEYTRADGPHRDLTRAPLLICKQFAVGQWLHNPRSNDTHKHTPNDKEGANVCAYHEKRTSKNIYKGLSFII